MATNSNSSSRKSSLHVSKSLYGLHQIMQAVVLLLLPLLLPLQALDLLTGMPETPPFMILLKKRLQKLMIWTTWLKKVRNLKTKHITAEKSSVCCLGSHICVRYKKRKILNYYFRGNKLYINSNFKIGNNVLPFRNMILSN